MSFMSQVNKNIVDLAHEKCQYCQDGPLEGWNMYECFIVNKVVLTVISALVDFYVKINSNFNFNFEYNSIID